MQGFRPSNATKICCFASLPNAHDTPFSRHSCTHGPGTSDSARPGASEQVDNPSTQAAVAASRPTCQWQQGPCAGTLHDTSVDAPRWRRCIAGASHTTANGGPCEQAKATPWGRLRPRSRLASKWPIWFCLIFAFFGNVSLRGASWHPFLAGVLV